MLRPMNGSLSLPQLQPTRPNWQHELQRLDVGEIRLDVHNRALYATDASLYQVMPLAVVLPSNVEQMRRLLSFCNERKIPLLPRGGGTSLAGQCTSEAIVLDVSQGCRELRSIDVTNKTCVVDPGISPDELNRKLASSRLMFAPDPATSAQASIGGCIGNNAAGSRSIRYGRTSENVARVEIILPSGQTTTLGLGAGRRCPVALRLAREVSGIVRRHASEIRGRFPKTIRRNAGYGLDLVLHQIDRGVADEDLDLTGLICGSEGTLALVTAATLKLHPVPLARGLAIAAFDSVDAAMDAVVPLLATNPTAVELLDDTVLTTARNNAVCSKMVDYLPKPGGRDPMAVLYVEYQADQSLEELEAGFAAMEKLLPNAAMQRYRDAASLQQVWQLRKSGEALLHGLSAHRKPLTFVEDNAVPVENLARFVREFRRIVERHGTTAAFYAHASVGVLHVRPLIDLHDSADRERMLAIAQDIADLARECGGVMSGEHGDGKARGPLLERFFGPELMSAFRAVKTVFDPNNILNPGNITAAGPVESIVQNLRLDSETAQGEDRFDTYFSYSDQEGFRGAVEMCNGAGFCRKTAGGTMCPSYRATLDERHSTRGRGNALREAILGRKNGSPSPDWDDQGTIDTLHLCLSCKACKSECPSNVDVARLKAEYTGQRYKRDGATLQARLFGQVRWLNRMGSILPSLANAISRAEPIRALMNRWLNLAPQRSLPPFAKSLYRQFNDLPQSKAPARVVLFADCFTTYNEPHIGMAAVRVLNAFGYAVDLPQVGCCGRAMMSTGLMDAAVASADSTLEALRAAIDDPAVAAIVVCEPSCLSSMIDDWLDLRLKTEPALRKRLADKAFLVEEFIENHWDQHPKKPQIRKEANEIVFHGHCHQKALLGTSTATAVLQRLAGPDGVRVLDSGCCGMAGSFGFTADRYDLSMKIGELSVFPPVRASNASATVVAPGTSCRHQIADGTGRHALHPIELIARAIDV